MHVFCVYKMLSIFLFTCLLDFLSSLCSLKQMSNCYCCSEQYSNIYNFNFNCHAGKLISIWTLNGIWLILMFMLTKSFIFILSHDAVMFIVGHKILMEIFVHLILKNIHALCIISILHL